MVFLGMPTKVESDSVEDESASFAVIIFSFNFFFFGKTFLGLGVNVHFFSSSEGTQMGIWGVLCWHF